MSVSDDCSRLARYGEAYINALDRGDFTIVAAVLGEAVCDPELEELLTSIDEELHREAFGDPSLSAADHR